MQRLLQAVHLAPETLGLGDVLEERDAQPAAAVLRQPDSRHHHPFGPPLHDPRDVVQVQAVVAHQALERQRVQGVPEDLLGRHAELAHEDRVDPEEAPLRVL